MDSNEVINSFIEALYKTFPKYSRISKKIFKEMDNALSPKKMEEIYSKYKNLEQIFEKDIT